MPHDLEQILTYVSQKYGFDFPVSSHSFFRERIQDRTKYLGLKNLGEYWEYLESHPHEINRLLDILTINVSHFFRNPLTFEYLACQVLPDLFREDKSDEIRIWSAGCAMGEEPYSIAIQISELMQKSNPHPGVRIFATDINPSILEQAARGMYKPEQVKNIKYGVMETWFKSRGNAYHLDGKIKKMVNFSFYDMMDKRTYVPPESVFGNFDLVLCRNLLIYFSLKNQKKIFDKLYRSLGSVGYLVLGSAETIPETYADRFTRQIPCCPIFRKSNFDSPDPGGL